MERGRLRTIEIKPVRLPMSGGVQVHIKHMNRRCNFILKVPCGWAAHVDCG